MSKLLYFLSIASDTYVDVDPVDGMGRLYVLGEGIELRTGYEIELAEMVAQAIKALGEKLQQARELVNEQADDEALWFEATTCSEGYLQSALRKIHASIDGKTQHECALKTLQEQGNVETPTYEADRFQNNDDSDKLEAALQEQGE